MKNKIFQWLFLHRLFGKLLSFILGSRGIALIFPPAQVIFSPKLLNSGNDVYGHNIIYGTITLAGVTKPLESMKNFGNSAWNQELQSLKWLKDLKAVDTSIASKKANAMLESMMEWFPITSKNLLKPEINAARIINILSSYDFLNNEILPWQKKKLDENLAFSFAYLTHTYKKTHSYNLIFVIKSLILISISVYGYRYNLNYYIKQLEKVLNKQVLTDGFHVSRNVLKMLDIVADIIDIQQALDDVKQPVPIFLRTYIDKMAVAIRSMRHSDGSLAIFHGSLEGNKDFIDKVMLASKISSKPLFRMPYGGFARISSPETTLIIDTQGVIKNSNFYNSSTAIELSTNKMKVFVSASPTNNALKSRQNRDMFSNLILFNKNLEPIATQFAETTTEHKTAEDSETLIINSKIYQAQKASYNKVISVNKNTNSVLASETILLSSVPEFKKATIRFHLHPSVLIEGFENSRKVILRLPDKSLYSLTSSNYQFVEGESNYLGNLDDNRKTKYLDLVLTISGNTLKAKWEFKKL